MRYVDGIRQEETVVPATIPVEINARWRIPVRATRFHRKQRGAPYALGLRRMRARTIFHTKVRRLLAHVNPKNFPSAEKMGFADNINS